MSEKQPMNEFDVRKNKARTLEERGEHPFTASSHRTIMVSHFLERFDTVEGKQETIAGRIRLKREHGKIAFLQVEDDSAKVQVVLTVNDLGKERFTEVLELFDMADIVEVTGTPFVTKKGENSLLASSIRMLTKALLPLPDKWKGMQDEELRFRKRYVDMIMSPELRDMFRKKSRFWNAMREFLVKEGFLEVETPVLENTAGGADATPFVTHHNALDIDVFLRISMGELWQKRLMVAGFDKTFEVGRQFRNEGMSPEHLQDYTQMEFYWAYADYRDGMKLTQEMYQYVIQEAFGTLQFNIRGFEVDLAGDWPEIDYTEAVEKELGINVLDATEDELRAKCDELGLETEEHEKRGRLVDTLWKQVRKGIGGPVFLVNHPVEVSPLAKRREEDPRTVQRFQMIIAGSEVGNGYSELNDPIDQAGRFEEQANLREQGDTEAQMHDAEFVEALQHAMPPTCGFGVSERLFSFLMDKPIRETVLFPLLRPEQPTQQSEKSVAQGDAVMKTELQDFVDNTLEPFEVGMTREEAKALVFEEVQDENLRRHMLATEALMWKLAEHFGAASPESWAIAGLLHDVDYEKCTMERHSLDGAEMLEKLNIHPDVVDAVREHNHYHGIEPKTIMSKAMACLEQLTGLITACTYVRPDKSIHSVKVKSVKKKFKDKSFAAGVDRQNIKRSEELLNLTLEESIEICLSAMQESAAELGLEGEAV